MISKKKRANLSILQPAGSSGNPVIFYWFIDLNFSQTCSNASFLAADSFLQKQQS